ncbi:5-carboxymethyl-2-hydroxymuconate Delta-isomerase [Streptantibioticus cattleyicolor]|uniref:Isomerase n=1 Tax=Streptantibioticus cattleyicolor (strain ATCC 35852 / DSM 46488 / JCM 4925 / NBRC 14057 / NRRL 8057) TaxID=1003195 RepID=F8JM57_STREN
MPHITVDYSARLDAVFDRRAFVRELHPLVVETAGSRGVCKTFFRAAAETYAGDLPSAETAFVHVEIGLLPGRGDALKARLSEAVLDLLDRHLPADPGERWAHSVEVRDLAPSYRLSDDRRAARRHSAPAAAGCTG